MENQVKAPTFGEVYRAYLEMKNEQEQAKAKANKTDEYKRRIEAVNDVQTDIDNLNREYQQGDMTANMYNRKHKRLLEKKASILTSDSSKLFFEDDVTEKKDIIRSVDYDKEFSD